MKVTLKDGLACTIEAWKGCSRYGEPIAARTARRLSRLRSRRSLSSARVCSSCRDRRSSSRLCCSRRCASCSMRMSRLEGVGATVDGPASFAIVVEGAAVPDVEVAGLGSAEVAATSTAGSLAGVSTTSAVASGTAGKSPADASAGASSGAEVAGGVVADDDEDASGLLQPITSSTSSSSAAPGRPLVLSVGSSGSSRLPPRLALDVRPSRS